MGGGEERTTEEEMTQQQEQKSPSSPAQPSAEDEPRTPSPSNDDDDDKDDKDDNAKAKEEEEKKQMRKKQCEQLYEWLTRVATKPGRMLVNRDAIIDDQVKVQEEELERRNRAMCLRFKLVTAEGEAHRPRRGARGKEKAFRAAGLHDFTLVEESDKMFSSPMTRVWQPAKPAIIRVGNEYQAEVPEFDEEVKKAIVDNLEHFTEKETQMLGVRFWPPNDDNNNNSNSNKNNSSNSPTRKSTRKRSKSREPAAEEEENAAKRLAPSENNNSNVEQAQKIEGGALEGSAPVATTTAKAELDTNNTLAAGAVTVKTETQGEEVKDPDLVAFINAQGQEEVIRIVRVPPEDIAEARAKFKREVGDSLHVQSSFGLHDMGIVVANSWSQEERDIFAQHVTKNCDNLRPMKPLLPNKTMSQIISYYYNVWQTTRANPRRVDIWHPPEEKRSHKRERERALAKALAVEKRLRKQQQKAERKLAVAPEIILKQRCKKEVAHMIEWIRSSCATNPRHAAYNASRAETVTKLRQHMMERVHSLRLYSQNDKDIFDDYKQYFFQRMTSVKR